MSTYTFHVLYQHSTPQAVTTLVVLLSASVCIFLWFNRKSAPVPAILSTDDDVQEVVTEPAPTTNLSKETAPDVPQPPTPSTPAPSSSVKKAKATKADKKGDKTKKKQGKQQQDGPPVPKVRTLAHRRPARRLEDPGTASVTEDQQEEQHAVESPSIEASSSEVKPPEDSTSTGSQNSPPRAASPSPSESTTATTAVTIQSSTLVLTPPPTVLPNLVSVPVEHEKPVEVPQGSPRATDDSTVRVADDIHEQPNAPEGAHIEHEEWIRVDNETPTIERREPPTPLLVLPQTVAVDIASPTSPQKDTESIKPSPKASESNIPPPDDGETVVPSPTPSNQPPAIVTPATPEKSEPPTAQPTRPSPRPITPSENPRSPRSRQPSSGGVGLGIPGTTPASGSQSRVGVTRSSPAGSPLRTGQLPLPPRHRKHQPGQPPQIPPPLVPPPFGQYAGGGGRPGTPGSGLRSPTSPGVPFSGWIPGPSYSPMHQQPPPPQAFLRPYPPPGFMPPSGPLSPYGAAAPPAGFMPYMYHPGNVNINNMNNNVHGRSRSASDISTFQGAVAGMTSINPAASQDAATTSTSKGQNMKGKTKVSDDGKEEEKNEEDFVIEFPTLNPTPGKPAPSSEPESTGDVQPAEQPPPPSGWMSPGFSPYPPEMVGYPAPWSPQATAYFHPRPYPPHHIPGASTPSASSASSSPAWTHLGLPPPNGGVLPRPNAVVASIPEGGDQEGQQQPSYAGSPPEEDLRRQSLANSIANKPGTAPSSVSGSVTSSPRVGFHHLHPVVAPSAMPPYPQPLSPLTPTSSHGNLLPNPHFMRQGTTPSPGPMANWQGNPGYFVPLPHPQWIGAQNSSRSGTPSGEHPGGSFLASPRSRSSSPFVGGRATPPVQPMYPGYFGQPPPLPHPNYPFGPAPVPPMQHSLMMQGLPPNPGSSYMNGRYPTPLQSRSRQNTASEAGGLEEERRDGDNDGLAGLPDADANDSEGFRAASVSSGRSSRGSSRAASAQLETGGGGTAKGGGPSPIEEEPPSTQTA